MHYTLLLFNKTSFPTCKVPDRHIVLSNYNTIITISIKMLLKLNPPGLCAHVYGGLHKPQSNVYSRDFGSSHQYITFTQKISYLCKPYFFMSMYFGYDYSFFNQRRSFFRFAQYDMRAHCINVSSITDSYQLQLSRLVSLHNPYN